MKVEIWSDIICPWCYIGKRRFEQALSTFEHRDQVELVWRSYELDPSAPTTTHQSLNEMLSSKYGVSLAQAAAMNQRVTQEAARVGLTYRLEQARPGNTFDAHRLTHFAAAHGLREAMVERLMQAYFSEGQPISDREVLVRLAAEVGLDADAARAALESTAYAGDVREDQQRAMRLGIRGVPFFVIDSQFGVSGAQPLEVFEQALERAWAESHPLTLLNATTAGDADCADGTCAIGE